MARIQKKLWEINKEIADLQELLDNSNVDEDGNLVNYETGEVFPLDKIDALEAEHEEKMKNCLYVYKNYFDCVEAGLTAQRDLLYSQIDAINAKIKSNKQSKKNFGTYLLLCMNGEKWKAADNSYSCWTVKDVSTDVFDEAKIPDKYCKIEIIREPDRNKIKAAIQAGEKIEGAKLIEKKGFRMR